MIKVKCCFNALEGHSVGISLGMFYTEFFNVSLGRTTTPNVSDQSVTNIFKYSNIRIYWSQIYIRPFVRINFSITNIFGHSFVSNLFVQIYSDIRW